MRGSRGSFALRPLGGFALDALPAVGRLDLDAAFGAGNGLPDQLFDRDHRFLIERGDDRDRGAGAAGAAGAADAMDVVVGMMRDVEIEDVADGGNVEAAGGDVGGDQQRNLTLAELIERCGARRLIHVAVQGADAEAVLLQRFVEQRRLRACGCRR